MTLAAAYIQVVPGYATTALAQVSEIKSEDCAT